MRFNKVVFASKSASILPAPAKLITLADLLDAATVVLELAPSPSAQKRREWLRGLRSGVSAISEFLGKREAEGILISEIVNIGVQFDEHVRHKGPSVRKDRKAQHHLLIGFARSLKCCPEMFAVEDAWERIPLKTAGTGTLIRDMIRQELDPEQITERHLSERAEEYMDQQYTRRYRRGYISVLKSSIRKAGVQASFPHLDTSPAYLPQYSINIRKMDPNLHAELDRILSWVSERDQRGFMRSGKTTRAYFIRNSERLYGYLVNIRHMPKTVGLEDIFTREAICDCARWLHRSRGWKRVSLGGMLSSFHSMLSVYPRFKDRDFSWILDLNDEFPKEMESQKEARTCVKAFEYNYDALAVIPALLCQGRSKSRPLGRSKREPVEG